MLTTIPCCCESGEHFLILGTAINIRFLVLVFRDGAGIDFPVVRRCI